MELTKEFQYRTIKTWSTITICWWRTRIRRICIWTKRVTLNFDFDLPTNSYFILVISPDIFMYVLTLYFFQFIHFICSLLLHFKFRLLNKTLNKSNLSLIINNTFLWYHLISWKKPACRYSPNFFLFQVWIICFEVLKRFF